MTTLEISEVTVQGSSPDGLFADEPLTVTATVNRAGDAEPGLVTVGAWLYPPEGGGHSTTRIVELGAGDAAAIEWPVPERVPAGQYHVVVAGYEGDAEADGTIHEPPAASAEVDIAVQDRGGSVAEGYVRITRVDVAVSSWINEPMTVHSAGLQAEGAEVTLELVQDGLWRSPEWDPLVLPRAGHLNIWLVTPGGDLLQVLAGYEAHAEGQLGFVVEQQSLSASETAATAEEAIRTATQKRGGEIEAGVEIETLITTSMSAKIAVETGEESSQSTGSTHSRTWELRLPSRELRVTQTM
jgi:hypothetical protein